MKPILKGKVAIVTGSGQGIGRGIAMYFAKCGAKVVTNNRRPYHQGSLPAGLDPADAAKYRALSSDAEKTAHDIRTAGGEAAPCYADVSKPSEAQRLVEFAIHHFGRLDILVNNAAGLGEGTVASTSEQQWEKLINSKMTGAFNTMHFAIPQMVKQKAGTILNSASNAWVGIADLAAYSAGNAGLVGLTKASAKELIASGITVNAYCPQAMSPGHLLEFNKTIKSLKAKFGPAAQPSPQKMAAINKKHGDPEKLAPFLSYLCTGAGHHYSGDVFSVTADGEVSYFNDPKIIKTIKNQAGWTQEELQKAVPQELLSNYLPLAERDNWQNNAADSDDLRNGVIFNRGQAISGFAGAGPAFVNLFIGPHHPSKCSVGNVTMAPGTHSNWHCHSGYQLLLVTGGQGFYQEEGKPVQRIKKGDVIEAAPGVKHWHGADQHHWFTCIGMILNAEGTTEDCGPVQNYQQLS